jgi:hypothetical protein
VSGTAELTLPSGNERYGLGTRLVVLETSALAGQRIGRRSFAHLQAGVALPLNIASTPNEVFWRGAFGTTLNSGRASAAWTPMMEVAAHRETEYRDPIRWDLIPQLQVTLSRRQHITATAGARVAVAGPSRVSTVLVSFGWDWFDGGIFEGW